MSCVGLEAQGDVERISNAAIDRDSRDIGLQRKFLDGANVHRSKHHGDSVKKIIVVLEQELEREGAHNENQIDFPFGVLDAKIFQQLLLMSFIRESQEIEVL